MDSEDVSLNDLKLSVNRALWGEVIPSLRKVILKWHPGDETAWIIFYHNGKISDAIEDHYSCIHTEVEAEYLIDPRIDFKIIRCDYPQPLPQEENTVYARCEPFTDPTTKGLGGLKKIIEKGKKWIAEM